MSSTPTVVHGKKELQLSDKHKCARICFIFCAYWVKRADSSWFFFACVGYNSCDPIIPIATYCIGSDRNSVAQFLPLSTTKAYKFMKQTILPQCIFITFTKSPKKSKQTIFRHSRRNMVCPTNIIWSKCSFFVFF